MRYAVILAGGRATRMSGRDKSQLQLGPSRLIEYVVARLSSQVDKVLISGPPSPFVDCTAIPDSPDATPGPAGAVFSVLDWIAKRDREAEGFLTAPTDGPFLPPDLYERLSADRTSIASDGRCAHPTFAWWRCDDLLRVKVEMETKASVSLTALAEACNAKQIVWDAPHAFFNINSPEDLERAARIYEDLRRREARG